MLDRDIKGAARSGVASRNVLLLGISYPCVPSQMEKHGFPQDILSYPKPSVEQAVECVRRGILTEMDARDLARCVATEQATATQVYTVSREIGAMYRSDRHVHCDFNARNFCQTLQNQFGEDIQFSQVILDYYWMPTGWLVTRWAKTLFQQTLPDLVRHQMLTFPSQRQRARRRIATGPPYDIDEGVVFLPFCAHVCKELVGAIGTLEQYYEISFLHKQDLHGHALWKGTMEIDADVMQSRLGKRLDQEEIYCTFRPKDIYESMEDPHVSKPAVMRILLAIENYDDIRMVRLRPLQQHERASVFKPRLWQPEIGGFKGLDFELARRRHKEMKRGKKSLPEKPIEEEKKEESVAPTTEEESQVDAEEEGPEVVLHENEFLQYYVGPAQDLTTYIHAKHMAARDVARLKREKAKKLREEEKARAAASRKASEALVPTRKGIVFLPGDEEELSEDMEAKRPARTAPWCDSEFLSFNPRNPPPVKPWDDGKAENQTNATTPADCDNEVAKFLELYKSRVRKIYDDEELTNLDQPANHHMLRAASLLYHDMSNRFVTSHKKNVGIERVARLPEKQCPDTVCFQVKKALADYTEVTGYKLQSAEALSSKSHQKEILFQDVVEGCWEKMLLDDGGLREWRRQAIAQPFKKKVFLLYSSKRDETVAIDRMQIRRRILFWLFNGRKEKDDPSGAFQLVENSLSPQVLLEARKSDVHMTVAIERHLNHQLRKVTSSNPPQSIPSQMDHVRETLNSFLGVFSAHAGESAANAIVDFQSASERELKNLQQSAYQWLLRQGDAIDPTGEFRQIHDLIDDKSNRTVEELSREIASRVAEMRKLDSYLQEKKRDDVARILTEFPSDGVGKLSAVLLAMKSSPDKCSSQTASASTKKLKKPKVAPTRTARKLTGPNASQIGLLLEQAVHVSRAEKDLTNGSRSRKGSQIGDGGFACRHCSECDDSGRNPTHGRYFPSTFSSFTVTVQNGFMNHIQYCDHCPQEIKAKLKSLAQESIEQECRGDILYPFWCRIHGIQQNDGEGRITEIEGRVPLPRNSRKSKRVASCKMKTRSASSDVGTQDMSQRCDNPKLADPCQQTKLVDDATHDANFSIQSLPLGDDVVNLSEDASASPLNTIPTKETPEHTERKGRVPILGKAKCIASCKMKTRTASSDVGTQDMSQRCDNPKLAAPSQQTKLVDDATHDANFSIQSLSLEDGVMTLLEDASAPLYTIPTEETPEHTERKGRVPIPREATSVESRKVKTRPASGDVGTQDMGQRCDDPKLANPSQQTKLVDHATHDANVSIQSLSLEHNVMTLLEDASSPLNTIPTEETLEHASATKNSAEGSIPSAARSCQLQNVNTLLKNGMASSDAPAKPSQPNEDSHIGLGHGVAKRSKKGLGAVGRLCKSSATESLSTLDCRNNEAIEASFSTTDDEIVKSGVLAYNSRAKTPVVPEASSAVKGSQSGKKRTPRVPRYSLDSLAVAQPRTRTGADSIAKVKRSRVPKRSNGKPDGGTLSKRKRENSVAGSSLLLNNRAKCTPTDSHQREDLHAAASDMKVDSGEYESEGLGSKRGRLSQPAKTSRRRRGTAASMVGIVGAYATLPGGVDVNPRKRRRIAAETAETGAAIGLNSESLERTIDSASLQPLPRVRNDDCSAQRVDENHFSPRLQTPLLLSTGRQPNVNSDISDILGRIGQAQVGDADLFVSSDLNHQQLLMGNFLGWTNFSIEDYKAWILRYSQIVGRSRALLLHELCMCLGTYDGSDRELHSNIQSQIQALSPAEVLQWATNLANTAESMQTQALVELVRNRLLEGLEASYNATQSPHISVLEHEIRRRALVTPSNAHGTPFGATFAGSPLRGPPLVGVNQRSSNTPNHFQYWSQN